MQRARGLLVAVARLTELGVAALTPPLLMRYHLLHVRRVSDGGGRGARCGHGDGGTRRNSIKGGRLHPQPSAALEDAAAASAAAYPSVLYSAQLWRAAGLRQRCVRTAKELYFPTLFDPPAAFKLLPADAACPADASPQHHSKRARFAGSRAASARWGLPFGSSEQPGGAQPFPAAQQAPQESQQHLERLGSHAGASTSGGAPNGGGAAAAARDDSAPHPLTLRVPRRRRQAGGRRPRPATRGQFGILKGVSLDPDVGPPQEHARQQQGKAASALDLAAVAMARALLATALPTPKAYPPEVQRARPVSEHAATGMNGVVWGKPEQQIRRQQQQPQQPVEKLPGVRQQALAALAAALPSHSEQRKEAPGPPGSAPKASQQPLQQPPAVARPPQSGQARPLQLRREQRPPVQQQSQQQRSQQQWQQQEPEPMEVDEACEQVQLTAAVSTTGNMEAALTALPATPRSTERPPRPSADGGQRSGSNGSGGSANGSGASKGSGAIVAAGAGGGAHDGTPGGLASPTASDPSLGSDTTCHGDIRQQHAVPLQRHGRALPAQQNGTGSAHTHSNAAAANGGAAAAAATAAGLATWPSTSTDNDSDEPVTAPVLAVGVAAKERGGPRRLPLEGCEAGKVPAAKVPAAAAAGFNAAVAAAAPAVAPLQQGVF